MPGPHPGSLPAADGDRLQVFFIGNLLGPVTTSAGSPSQREAGRRMNRIPIPPQPRRARHHDDNLLRVTCHGSKLPSGMGGLLAILAAEQPVEDAESA